MRHSILSIDVIDKMVGLLEKDVKVLSGITLNCIKQKKIATLLILRFLKKKKKLEISKALASLA